MPIPLAALAIPMLAAPMLAAHIGKKQKQAAAENDATAKNLDKQAAAAAQAGDHEFFADNAEALNQHIPATLLKVYQNTADRQNARNWQAGDQTVPLSPGASMHLANGFLSSLAAITGGGGNPNDALPVADSLSNVSGQIADVNQRMASTPPADRGPLLDQRQQLIDAESKLTTAHIAQREAAPTTPKDTGIVLPTPTRGATQSMTTPLGHRSITIAPHTSEGITSLAVAQANEKGLSDTDVLGAVNQYNLQAAKKGLPGIAPDFKVLNEFKDERFNKLRMQKEREILDTGVIDPAQAQQAAARWASEQLGGYIPDKFGDLIKYTPEERHVGIINQAMKSAHMMVEGSLRTLEAGGLNTQLQPGLFRNIVQSIPNIKPQEQAQALVDIAQMTANRLAPKLEANGVPGPLAMAKAIMLAGQLTGGVVPHEWQQVVAGNPSAFGLPPNLVPLYLTGRYNIFQPGGMDAMMNKASEQAMVDDLTKRAVGTINQPDVAANVIDRTRGAAPAQSLTGALKQAGPEQRQIEVKQRAADTAATTAARTEEERRQVVQSVATPLSELAKSLRSYMETSLTDPTKLYSAGTLYKDRLKAFRSIIAKGVLLQTGALNEQEQIAAMDSLSGLIEAKLRPDSTNAKIQTLNLILGKALGQPVDLLAEDPLKPAAKQPMRFNSQGQLMGTTPNSTPPTSNGNKVMRFDKQGNLIP